MAEEPEEKRIGIAQDLPDRLYTHPIDDAATDCTPSTHPTPHPAHYTNFQQTLRPFLARARPAKAIANAVVSTASPRHRASVSVSKASSWTKRSRHDKREDSEREGWVDKADDGMEEEESGYLGSEVEECLLDDVAAQVIYESQNR